MIQRMDNSTVTQFFQKGHKDKLNTIDGYGENVYIYMSRKREVTGSEILEKLVTYIDRVPHFYS